jgi:hypothetical protein
MAVINKPLDLDDFLDEVRKLVASRIFSSTFAWSSSRR